MNHPLAPHFDQFLTERTFLHNVTPRTIVWYQVAFKGYVTSLAADAPTILSRATLQRFVITLRERPCKASAR